MPLNFYGPYAEIAFILKAIEKGINISKPLFDISKFDLIVNAKKDYRVQVKSTRIKQLNGAYKFNTSCGNDKRLYREHEIDFVACYISSLDIWYILPIDSISSKTIRLYTNNKDHEFDQYKERWDFFQ